jgi:hypothetical protein
MYWNFRTMSVAVRVEIPEVIMTSIGAVP